MQAQNSNSNSAATEPPAQAQQHSTEVGWYAKELPPLKPGARELLEKYSGIPPDEVEEHIYEFREKAWRIHPYPCIGGFRFLSLNLSTFPIYPSLLTTLQQPNARFLDLGCCFGQEIRRLIYDGVPGSHCLGTDLRPEFFDLGYDLFRDREKCSARFFAADIFDEEDEEDGGEWKALEGRVDVISAGSFFHLFDRVKQVKVAERVTRLLKRNSGAVVVGRQVGSLKPGLYASDSSVMAGEMYRHDAESWRGLWEEVGGPMGVRFEVECRMEEAPMYHWKEGESDTRVMFFTVKML